MLDLAADRRQELPACRQLGLDVLSLRRLLRDDPLLLLMGVVQLDLVMLDRHLRRAYLPDDVRVLGRRRVDCLDAVEQILEARRPEQQGQRRVVLRRRICADEPLG